MWVWALRGSRHFKPAAYSVQPQLPHRAELIIVSLGGGADCEIDKSALGGASAESGGANYANGGAKRGE